MFHGLFFLFFFLLQTQAIKLEKEVERMEKEDVIRGEEIQVDQRVLSTLVREEKTTEKTTEAVHSSATTQDKEEEEEEEEEEVEGDTKLVRGDFVAGAAAEDVQEEEKEKKEEEKEEGHGQQVLTAEKQARKFLDKNLTTVTKQMETARQSGDLKKEEKAERDVSNEMYVKAEIVMQMLNGTWRNTSKDVQKTFNDGRPSQSTEGNQVKTPPPPPPHDGEREPEKKHTNGGQPLSKASIKSHTMMEREERAKVELYHVQTHYTTNEGRRTRTKDIYLQCVIKLAKLSSLKEEEMMVARMINEDLSFVKSTLSRHATLSTECERRTKDLERQQLTRKMDMVAAHQAWTEAKKEETKKKKKEKKEEEDGSDNLLVRMTLRRLQETRTSLEAADEAVVASVAACKQHENMVAVHANATKDIESKRREHGRLLAASSLKTWTQNVTCHHDKEIMTQSSASASSSFRKLLQAERESSNAQFTRAVAEVEELEKVERKRDQHLLAELAHGPCVERKTCGQCTSSTIGSSSDILCGWCDLTMTCEEGSKHGPNDWDCTDTRTAAGAAAGGGRGGGGGGGEEEELTHFPLGLFLKSSWHFVNDHNNQCTSSSKKMTGIGDWTRDSPRPTSLQLGGVDSPEIEEMANDAKRKTTEKTLQNKRLARRDAIELAHETSLAGTRKKEVEREASLLREKFYYFAFFFFLFKMLLILYYYLFFLLIFLNTQHFFFFRRDKRSSQGNQRKDSIVSRSCSICSTRDS